MSRRGYSSKGYVTTDSNVIYFKYTVIPFSFQEDRIPKRNSEWDQLFVQKDQQRN